MALCASGEMSLGGSTAGRSVNLELDRAATASINMNETAVRTLAAQASGAICLTNFYGKSSFGFGSTFCGGFYMGTICAAGSCYYLIMAPNATGCANCTWKTTQTCSSVGNEQCNGFASTYNCLANADHPAGNFTATRSISGISDWYLPALCELCQLYNNKACLPAGEGFPPEVFVCFWSSTESGLTVAACVQNFNNGIFEISNKVNSRYVRAVRRVSF